MAYMRLGDLLTPPARSPMNSFRPRCKPKKPAASAWATCFIDSGVITQRQLIDALQMQLGVDYIDLTRVSIPVELAKYVPRAIAKKYCVVPVKLVKDELYVAMSDPLDFIAQEELKRRLPQADHPHDLHLAAPRSRPSPRSTATRARPASSRR